MPQEHSNINGKRVDSLALLGSAARAGGGTLASRVLGFLRDVIIARAFGATAATDAFLVAFRLSNLLRRLFAEGAFSQAFVPVLTEYRETRGHEDVRELTACVSGVLGAILLLVSAFGVLAAPVLILVFAPGFVDVDAKYELAVQLLRITFPYLFFISLTALAAGILNTCGRFGVPAFTPAFLNISLIGAALLLAPRMEEPVFALAVGVLVAGLVQLAFLLPFLASLRLLVVPKLKWAHKGVRQIARLILPAVFGASVAQINIQVDALIASFLVTGSISWLYFSDRVVEFPLGVFGIALATVVLPSLSARHTNREPEAFSRTLDWALRLVVTIGVPGAVGLSMLSTPIVTTLFYYGAFGDRDVGMTSLSLVAYATGLVGFILVKVLAPGFFARQDMKTPVRVAVVALAANVVLNLVLVLPLRHAGLALATSLAAYLNAALLFRALRRAGVYRPMPGWRATWLRTIVSTSVMAAALWCFVGEDRFWLDAGVWTRILHLVAAILGGVLLYAFVQLALGLRLRDLLGSGGR